MFAIDTSKKLLIYHVSFYYICNCINKMLIIFKCGNVENLVEFLVGENSK